MAEQPNVRLSGRRFRQWGLGEEVQSRFHPIHYSASFAIMGVDGTGRKTLAQRFGAMDAAVPPDEGTQDFYSSFHLMTGRPQDNQRPITLHLHAYVCPTDPGRPPDPPFYHQEWESFCCIVFLFDITREATFQAAKTFMILHNDVRMARFLGGNKSDLRVSAPQRSLVSRRDIEAVASTLRVKYHEISARTRQNVRPLLEDIQQCALQEKYVIHL